MSISLHIFGRFLWSDDTCITCFFMSIRQNVFFHFLLKQIFYMSIDIVIHLNVIVSLYLTLNKRMASS